MPPEAQFCIQCGHRLAEPQADAAQDRLQQYIPKELLAKLESARTSGGMQGERRVVTMLFCDVQGSTVAADQLDPEEWAEIMNDAFEYLIAPVYRYEGILARLMGDAILAFFGAPIAHEDDPQRAVLAGLDIVQGIHPYREQVKRQWDLDFNVRVGINTGLVVVGEVGTDLRVEYTAMGDAVNLAARMEQTAEPGTVQITEDTHKLIAPLFEFEDLGGIEVKGKDEPVQTYRVLRPKAEPGRLRGIEGLEAPLVGRDQELNRLRDAITALRQGRGQIVSVIGEAGLGKSRLIAELRQALFAEVESGEGAGIATETTIGWYEGRSLSYESSTPYAPFVDLLSHYFGLQAEQTDAEKYDNVRTKIAELLSDRVPEIAPFIATLLGIQLTGEDLERVRYLEPPQLRDRVFRAMHDFVQQLAAVRPLVLVFEDLHWSDPTSLDLLEQLMPLTDREMLMIAALFRPQRQEPSWRFHEIATRDYTHRYTSIVLEPLDEGNSRTLVANLLHVEDLPEQVRTLILTKAEGNPFFVEEVIRSLLDAKLVVRENSHWRATREIENIAVPDTLAGVITARLDRLDEASKRVAQTASVIGRQFEFNTLTDVHETPQVLDEALTDLQRRELIREKSRIPQQVYMFKHALTQETAYASLLLSKRRELHRRVAECLEQTDPERVTDIARHFFEAREHARALPCLVEAGDRAARAYSTPEAIELYMRALEIVQTVKDLPLARRAFEGLGGALAFANDVPQAVETYQKMLEFAKAHDDIPMEVSALNKLAFVVGLRLGQFPEAVKHLDDAERLAREHHDIGGLAELHMIQCNFCTATADFEGAVDHLSEAARIGRELDLEEPKLYGLTHIANTQTFMTRFEDAWQTANEARQFAEEVGNRQYLSELLTFSIPSYHLRNGDLDAVYHEAEEGMNMATQIGSAASEASGAYFLGKIAWLQGEYERAIAYQQRALQVARMAGIPWYEAMILCALGTAYLDISPELVDQTAEFHAQALQVMEQPGGIISGATAW
ncbi:MAG: AAA family ATPase, partial [Candidatus Bipolaricaulia bacterium]